MEKIQTHARIAQNSDYSNYWFVVFYRITNY